MAANLTIAADVIDITVDTPTSADSFYVDTNAWYWLTYTKASLSSRQYQITDYPTYLSKAKTEQSKLIFAGFTLSELSHIIERNEYDIFNSANPVSKKEYRHNFSAERQNVVSEIDLSWLQIQSLGIFLESRVTEDFTKKLFTRISGELLDGYDAMIAETLSRSGLTQIITDDGDFATIAGIQVFTSNPTVLRLARQQGKLITR